MNMPNHFHRSARQNGGDAPATDVFAPPQSSQHSPSEQNLMQEFVVQPYLVQRAAQSFSAQPFSAQPFSAQHSSLQQARRSALYVLAACLISAGFSPAVHSDTTPASSPALAAGARAQTAGAKATGTKATAAKVQGTRPLLAQPIATNGGNMLTGLRWQQYSRIAKHSNQENSLRPVVTAPSFKPQTARLAVDNRNLVQGKALKAPVIATTAAKTTAANQPAPLAKAKLQQPSPAKKIKPVQVVGLPGQMSTVRGIGVAAGGVRSLAKPVAVQPGTRRVRVTRPASTPWILKVGTATPAASTRATASLTRAIMPRSTTMPSKTRVQLPGRGILPPAMLISPPPLSAPLPLTSQLPLTAQLPPSVQLPQKLELPRVAHVSLNDKTNPTAQLGWRDAKGAPMRKVITVSSLKKLPPATQPLPVWMRGATINVDQVTPSLPPASRNGQRLSQNPAARPLRQPTRPVTNSDRLPNQIEVSVGTFVVLLTTSDLDTVAVAEPGIADVAVVNSRSVLVNGKTPGVTSLVIVDRYRIRQYQVRVVAAPGTLPRDIAAQIGLPGVGVRQVRDAIILEGEVENAEELRRAVEIAGVFSTKVINQLSVRGAPSSAAAIETQIERAINLPNVTVQIIGTDTALLQGTVERSAQRQQAETVASAFAKRVVNLIELPPLTLEQVQEALGTGTDTAGAGAPNGTLGFNQGGVRVRQVGDQIILEGTAPTQNELDQALAIAGRTGLQVVNRLQVARAESTLLNSVISSIGLPGVTATGNEKLLVLHGVVPDTNAAIRAEQVALSYATEVQNLLQTPNPLLVNVDVSVVEINKGNFRNLGITFPGLTETTAGFGAGLPIGGIGIGGGRGTNLGATFDATLRALVDNNKARVLSNPRMTVLSGRTAGFLVGGQIPVPEGSTTNENGTTLTLAFKDFGILVNVVPVANADGVITMRILTDVSQIDTTIGFNFPGSSTLIPGFTKRTTATEVSMTSGGTIALSGLINNNVTEAVRRVPVLSRIPILGSLFTSKSFQRNETELVFFITPRLLPNPLQAGQTAPVTVVSGLDNQGTPTYGTGAVQASQSTLRPGSSDRAGVPPVASGGGLTVRSQSSGGGSAGGGGGGGG